MGLFDRLFGRKKENNEEVAHTQVPEVKEAVEEVEIEDHSQPTVSLEQSQKESSQSLELENKQDFYEDLEERLAEDQVLNEVIENKSQVFTSDPKIADFQQKEDEKPISSNENSEERQENIEHSEQLEESNHYRDAATTEGNQADLSQKVASFDPECSNVEEQNKKTTEADKDETTAPFPLKNAESIQPAKQEELEIHEPKHEKIQTETIQEKYDRSLKKTRTGFGARLNAFFANFRSVDEDFFEDLEELLITSDVGVQVASNLTEELRYEARIENAKKPEVLRKIIIEKLVDIYEKDGRYHEKINFQTGLTVMLFVGVNGVGKTTSIGKLAYKYKKQGKKVMLVAADTFRAGAVAQLAEWGRRVDVPVVTGPEKSDPASVVFDGMERAQAENVDILMIDTAGRLQNKDNLMAELEKIGRIIKRVNPDAPHETFLALDASTGQNALVQAKEFSKITPVTGIVLTKIDGTARGGVVLAIRQELDIPVKLIGFGEQIDDIGEFNSEDFMRGLLEGLI